MLQNDNVINSFCSYLEDRGKSGGTIAGLSMEIRDFANFIKEREKQLVEMDQDDVEAFGEHLLQNGKTEKTVHRRLHNLLIFIHFLSNKKIMEKHTENYITNSSIYIRTLPRALTVDEIKKLIQACPDVKLRALFSFLYETGIRPAEVSKLKQEDVNWEDLYVLVKGKEDEKPRPVFLNRKLKVLIKKYLRTRKDSLPNLFVAGKVPMTKARIQVLFMDLAKKIGLEGHVGMESLRRSLAAHMLEQGMDIGHVAQLLGEKDFDTLKCLLPSVTSNKAKGGKFVSALDM